MSVSLSEVLKSAGFDVERNYKDALWLQAQRDEFEELTEKAIMLEESKEAYDDFVEQQEELGITEVPTFEEWRTEETKPLWEE